MTPSEAAPAPTSLRVLLTNLTLGTRTGSECYVRDLAVALVRRGHRPIVYSPQLGPLAEELRAETVPVVSDLERVGAAPDLIHGQHLIPTLAALHAFPATPGLFVCHSRLVWYDQPAVHPRLLRYVAVDDNCADRLLFECGLPEARVRTLLNWVDLELFRPRAALPARPRRALLFSTYVGADGVAELRAACAEQGLSLETLGEGGLTRPDPETVLGDYDVVFAKARSALEALAVGAAVVLCGEQRLGPLVTPEQFDRLRRWNFGMRALSVPIERGRIRDELCRYDAEGAALVSARVRREAGLAGAVDQYLALYGEVLHEWRHAPRPAPEIERQATARAFAQLDVLSVQLELQAARIAGLERALLQPTTASAASMAALQDEDAGRIALSATLPERLAPGQQVFVEAQLSNGSSQALASAEPHPVHVAARWFRDGGAILPDTAPRTRLRPALEPDRSGRYFVVLVAPNEPGSYVLRLTLVQDGLRWFDHVGSLCVEAAVKVV